MTYEAIQPILEWIQAHPTWAGFAVFLISLSESLAIVGLVVPGVVMMTAIGAMMGSGHLPFWETLLWAILGAIAGDGISYWLGYHFHEHLRDFWPFKQFPKLLERGEVFFRQHGGKSIIFGRFVGPVRPMIPVIAGMMDMKPRVFLFFNIVSAIAWAPLYSLPGILMGASVGMLSKEAGSRIVLIVLFLLLILWLIYVLLVKLGGWLSETVMKTSRRSWNAWQSSNRLPWLHKMLATAQGTEEGQLGAACLFLISALGFWIIASNVENSTGLSEWNEPIYQVLRALYIDSMVDITTLFTGLGDPKVLLPAALAVGAWFLWRKRYIAFFCWMGTIFGGVVLFEWVRHYFAIPRPEGLVQFTTEYSFPSGHVVVSILCYGLAAAFIQHTVSPHHRYIPWLITLPLILLILLSRLYLGVHWFTDTMGGLALGTACVSLGILVMRRIEHRFPPLRSILIPGLIVLSLTFGYYSVLVYPQKRVELVRQWPTQEIKTRHWWKGSNSTADLYRTGAFKRIATFFDIQWLGSLKDIETILSNQGWQKVPTLNFQSSLSMLADKPPSNTIPVLPKFHRDRLPALTMTQFKGSDKRQVLQLWHSDYLSEQGTPLWVGTLRLEESERPFSLLTYFQETPPNPQLLEQFEGMLQKSRVPYKTLPLTGHPTQKVLLIQTPSK